MTKIKKKTKTTAIIRSHQRYNLQMTYGLLCMTQCTQAGTLPSPYECQLAVKACSDL